MARNRGVADFVLIGDGRLRNVPSNVRFINWNFAQIVAHTSKTLDVNLSAWAKRSCTGDRCGRQPTNKVSDMRPFMGALFSDIAMRYT